MRRAAIAERSPHRPLRGARALCSYGLREFLSDFASVAAVTLDWFGAGLSASVVAARSHS